MGDERSPGLERAVGIRAMPGSPRMDDAGTRRYFDRHDFNPRAHGLSRSLQRFVIVLRSMELAKLRKQTPPMRAPHVLDGAAGCGSVIERHPTCRVSRRNDPVAVTVVLVKPECLGARRLPYHIVLTDAGARPARQRRADPTDLFLQDDACYGPVRLPAVTDLARQIGWISARLPVPFVWIQPGFELAAKNWLKALAREPPRQGSENARESGSHRCGTARSVLGRFLSSKLPLVTQNTQQVDESP